MTTFSITVEIFLYIRDCSLAHTFSVGTVVVSTMQNQEELLQVVFQNKCKINVSSLPNDKITNPN